MFAENRSQIRIEIANEEVIAAIRHGDIGMAPDGHVRKYGERETGYADKAYFALLFQLFQCRDGFVDDLFTIAKLNIVSMKNIEVVRLQPFERLFHARHHAPR